MVQVKLTSSKEMNTKFLSLIKAVSFVPETGFCVFNSQTLGKTPSCSGKVLKLQDLHFSLARHL